MSQPTFSAPTALRWAVALAAAFSAGCGDGPQYTMPQAPAAPAKPAPPPQEESKPAEPSAESTSPATTRVSTLAAYYHLDEASGTAVADASGKGHTGRANTGVTLGALGKLHKGAGFSRASDGQITIATPLDLKSDRVTLALWVWSGGAQDPGTALLYCRGSGGEAGITIKADQQLTYVWNQPANSSFWRSGLSLRDGVWTFIALVVEPNKASLYMGVPGERLAVAERVCAHGKLAFDGPLTIGRDPILGKGFEGAIDEIGIWENALTGDEVDKLFHAAQKAAVANPDDDLPEVARKGTDYERALAGYQYARSAYGEYLRTRQNPAVLVKLERSLHACVALLERSKANPPPGADPQAQIDRCNKLIFDLHATRQVNP